MTQDEISQIALAISENLKVYHKEILTVDEAAQYTGLTKSALYKLTHNRQIPFSKPGGKILFFSRQALDQWMMSNPVATTDELNDRAQAYCMK
ncbi:MAG: helix-turn-helix domain-containing protein [Bacteroides sp.]|nr:helix-turn-helix domain-containing protein [Bacteroides sp.]